MAINIKDTYPANADSPSLDYPTGSFRNDSTPESEDGTPLEKAWANDFLGFRDAALKDAGIVASGIIETAQSSQVLDALKLSARSVVNADGLGGANQQYIALLGIGQRVAGVTYTNTSGRPIFVVVGKNSSASSATLAALVSGVAGNVQAGNVTSLSRDSFGFIVPIGAQYIVTVTGSTIEFWSEIR